MTSAYYVTRHFFLSFFSWLCAYYVSGQLLKLWYIILQYARPHLLSFLFRHGHYEEACSLFFPANSAPPPPQLSSLGVVTSSSSPQRPDPLATDYGTIDDLCDLCVGYGAMPVLEEVISSRVSLLQDQSMNQYTAVALARICLYCETHKHFNYLHEFQVFAFSFPHLFQPNWK